MRLVLLALLPLVPAALGPASFPQDPAAWSRFRGPNGTGLAAGRFPSEIGPGTNERWSAAVPPGHSSPVLSRTRVFLTGLEGDELVTFAHERADGSLAWKRAVPRARKTSFHADNHPAAPSVVVGAGLVAAFFDEFGLVAYDHEGNERWRHALGPFDNAYGLGASPILAGDVLVLAVDQSTHSFVAGFSLADGRELWRTARPLAISGHVTPVLWRAPDGTDEVLLPGSFVLDAYDARTGARRWWVDGLPAEMKSVPVLLDGRLYMHGYSSPINEVGQTIALPAFAEALAKFDANEDGRVSSPELPDERLQKYFGFFDLVRDGALDAAEWAMLVPSVSAVNAALCVKVGGQGDVSASNVLWRQHRGIPQLPAPLVAGGIYWMLADQGGLVSELDPGTGALLSKERLEHAVDAYYAAPVGGDGKVYLLSQGGILTVLAAERGLRILQRADFGEPCYATPALEDGHVFLRSASKLYAFGE